jgi:hypothetical protein
MKNTSLFIAAGIVVGLSFCTEKEKVKPECTSFQITPQVQNSTCGSANGRIIVNSSSQASLEYSINGVNFQSSNEFSNLKMGSYIITVRDNNNCTETAALDLQEENDLSISASSKSNAGCGGNGGGLAITSSGGSGAHTYSVDDGVFQSSPDFSGLSSKNYRVTVKDASGCSKAITIRVPSGISYKGSIKSIIDGNCATVGCHVSGAQSPNFTVFANVKANAAKIKSLTGNKTMPKNGTLTDDQIQQIACWVDDGALDN